MDVLVLNKNFFAIQITSWQRALRLVYTDRASVVDEEYRTYSFNDWCELSKCLKDNPSGFIYTPNFKIAIPDVISLKYYDRIPFKEMKFTRKNIYELYGYRCCYCGKKFSSKELNLDHIIPRSRGGKSDWKNVVTSCINCNLKKGNSLPEEKGMKLVIKPTKPTYSSNLTIVMKNIFKVKTSWQKFIDNIYWNIELDQT
jgi:5-methylcytosine-specific restriction endonuclease McrA